MSKKICKGELEPEFTKESRKAKYYCKKCNRTSPKENWCCKPKAI